MAQYEANEEQLKALVGDNSGLTAATQAAIVALINTGAPTLSTDNASGTDNTNVGLVSQQNATFNNAEFTKVTTAVFDEGAKGTANLTSDSNITAELVNPNGLKVTTGDGNNDIAINGGEASVNTGAGEDLFQVLGNVKGELNSGLGDDEFQLDEAAQKNAEISVDAGDGFDLLTLFGNAVKHSFSFQNGKFHMSSANVSLDGVEVVATDVNQDGRITDTDHITVLATDNQESLAAKLYQVALGREGIDDSRDTLAGLNFWMEQATDPSFDHFGRAFLNCDEFHNKYDKVDDKAYVDALFANLGNPSEGASLKADLLSKLESGQLDRYEVAITLAENDLTVKVLGNDGQQYVIDSNDVNFDA